MRRRGVALALRSLLARAVTSGYVADEHGGCEHPSGTSIVRLGSA